MAQINLDQWPSPPIATGLITLLAKHGNALASSNYYKNIFGAEVYHGYYGFGPRACNRYTMVIGGGANSFKFMIQESPHLEGPVEGPIFLWLFTQDPNALGTRAIKGGCEDLSHEIADNDPNQVVIRRIMNNVNQCCFSQLLTL